MLFMGIFCVRRFATDHNTQQNEPTEVERAFRVLRFDGIQGVSFPERDPIVDISLPFTPAIIMCKVQSVYMPIPVVSGNEDNVIAVVSNNNFDESRAEQRGSELKRGGKQERSTSVAGILLGICILVLLFARSYCSCSLHRSRDDDYTGGVFLRGAAMVILEPGLSFHSPTLPMHGDSSQTDGPPEINFLLRSSFLRPIIRDASSMESGSGEGYELQRRTSPSFTSKDSGHLVRNSSEDDKSSDSNNASERKHYARISSEDDESSDSMNVSEDVHLTPRTRSSEDDDKIYLTMSYDDESEIATPMTPRRSIIVPRNKDLREQR